MFSHRYASVCVALSCVPIALMARAQVDSSAEAPPLVVEHVYVSAGAPSPGDRMVQAARIDVLEGLEKELRESASLGQTLEHLPGVRVIDTGNNAGVPVIRGLTGNRIRILSNSIGVDHQQYGIRHQPNLDPFLSERIEVVRGASSLLYGSDAMGGVIDVHGLALKAGGAERESDVDLRLDHFTNNEQNNIALRGRTARDRLSLAGGLVWRSGDAVDTPNDVSALETGDSDGPLLTGELPFTDFDQRNAQLGAAWHGENAVTTLRYNYWDTEQNYLLPVPPSGRGIGVDLKNSELQLRTDYRFEVGTTSWTARPTLAWQRNERRGNKAGNPRSGLHDGEIHVEFDQYVVRFEALHDGDGLFERGTLGLEVRERDQESLGLTLLEPGGTTTAVGVFAYEEKQFGMLLVQAGLRAEHIEVEGDEGKSAAATPFSGTVSNSYDVFSGAVGGSYPLNDTFTLAANLSQGFRAPTLFELFARGVHGGVAAVQRGNASLDAEESLNVDLSLRWRHGRTHGSVTYYQNRIDNYIYLQDSGESAGPLPIFDHQQDDAVLEGVEAEIEVALSDQWSLRAVADVIATENRATDQDLPLTPANEFLTELDWHPARVGFLQQPYLRASVRYSAAKDAAPGEPFAQFDRNPRFGSASTGSYWLVDFAAGALIDGPGDKPLRINIALRNAFDESYRDFLYSYKGYALNPGRDVRVTLEIPLS